MSATPTDTEHPDPFKPVAGTARIAFVANWTAGTACCDALEFLLEQSADGSGWTEVGRQTVAAGGSFEEAVDLAAGASFRIRAFPGDDGVSQGQDYSLVATFWSA